MSRASLPQACSTFKMQLTTDQNERLEMMVTVRENCTPERVQIKTLSLTDAVSKGE